MCACIADVNLRQEMRKREEREREIGIVRREEKGENKKTGYLLSKGSGDKYLRRKKRNPSESMESPCVCLSKSETHTQD